MVLKSRLTLVVVGVCAVWFIPFLTSPAQAATQMHSRITSKDGNHCVAQIAPLRSGQISSEIQSFRCFKTLSESIAAATNGRIHLSTRATGQGVRQALEALSKANTQSPNNLNIIAIFYVDANFQGNSLIDETSGPPCSSTTTYGWGIMPNGFYDDVSSVQGGYYGCTWYRLWAGIDYTGANQCYSGWTSYVGDKMNDQTKSVYFRISNPC